MKGALRPLVNHFSDAAKNFGLTLSLKKTEVWYQQPPKEAYSPPHISTDGTNLNTADHIIYLVASSPMMPPSARILTTACLKPAVPLAGCQRCYGRITHSTSPQRSRCTEPLSFPSSCVGRRPGFSIGSRSGYLSGFTNAACAPFFFFLFCSYIIVGCLFNN